MTLQRRIDRLGVMKVTYLCACILSPALRQLGECIAKTSMSLLFSVSSRWISERKLTFWSSSTSDSCIRIPVRSFLRFRHLVAATLLRSRRRRRRSSSSVVSWWPICSQSITLPINSKSRFTLNISQLVHTSSLRGEFRTWSGSNELLPDANRLLWIVNLSPSFKIVDNTLF